MPEQKSPAACGEDHGEAGCSAAVVWSTTVEQGSTLQPVEETTVEQVDLH